jgi:hypothetical protein
MKGKGSSFALLSVGVLAACAVSSEGDLRTGDPCTQGFIDEVRLERDLAEAASCCKGFQEMRYVSPRQGYIMALDKESPVFAFPTGKSRFVALDVREFGKTRLELVPLATTALTAPPDYTCSIDRLKQVRSRAVKPVIQWLDSDKKPLGEPQRGRDSVTTPVAGWILDRPPGAQFMILYSYPKEYGTKLDLAAPSAGMLAKTETVGLGAAVHPQRTIGPAAYTATSTGYFESFIPGPMQ